MTSTIQVWQDDLPDGTVYRPGNAVAHRIAEQIDIAFFSLPTLDCLNRAGYRIETLNRPAPIPHPWAGKRP